MVEKKFMGKKPELRKRNIKMKSFSPKVYFLIFSQRNRKRYLTANQSKCYTCDSNSTHQLFSKPMNKLADIFKTCLNLEKDQPNSHFSG